MWISNFFTLREATVTSTGLENKIEDEKILENVIYTASRMDTIRQFFNSACLVTSFYRSVKVNNAVSGAKNSAHLRGMAVDFSVRGINISEVFEKIKKSGLSYDQLIFYPKSGFVHVAFCKNIEKERKQAFTQY